MRAEIHDLKIIASNGVSKIRSKEKSLLEERQRDRHALFEMEKKLESANNLILALRSTRSERFAIPDEVPSSIKEWKTPLNYHTSHLSGLKFSFNEVNRRIMSPTPSSGGTSWYEKKFAAELSAEKELRYKAEEICAGVLANAKTGFEKRDSEIKQLRSKLFKLSTEAQKTDIQR